MSYSNDSPNECVNQVTCIDDSDDIERSFYKISQKNESGCFTEYFDNLSSADNLLGLEHLQMTDEINQSNICYWKNPRKLPKFLHEYYLLGDTIGKGSYGKVKDCVDMRTMKRYAMKIVHRMKIKKIPSGMKHVENEITLMKTLSHKNVVRLIDDFQEFDPERRCLVMEFCLGSIHDLQTNGILESSNQFRCLPEWQTRNYFIQIVEGLEYLHHQGLIHKDMKPGNFLLTEHDCVKITDFGVSEKLDIFQRNSLISGGQTTPAIQPPELAIGAPNICGYKLDIYGTGVSLYFMLCGRVPFSNPNILLIFDEIAAGEYTIPSWVSVSASDLIRNMMCKDVNARFNIKRIKSHDWYLNTYERMGAKIDPKIYLNYAARDRSKENLYRLSTGMPCVGDLSRPELPAIMPLTVSSRLRTFYNWPMTEEEANAEIDEQLIIGEHFSGPDINTHQGHDAVYISKIIKPSEEQLQGQSQGIRFFIQSEERNDNHSKIGGGGGGVGLDHAKDYSMSLSLSHSVFCSNEYSDRDNISHNTIPIANSTSRHSASTKSFKYDKKSSGSDGGSGNTTNKKSKKKFGYKIPSRCTQS